MAIEIEPTRPAGAHRWAAWGTLLLAAATAVAAVSLGVRNGSFSRDPWIFLSIGMIVVYAAVGGLLALRVPRNPIGWLFLFAGLGLLIGGALSEYTIYALVTTQGGAPLGPQAAWLQSVSLPMFVGLPLVLVLFPTGHVPSPRWRWLPPALIAAAVMVTVGTMLAPGRIDVTDDLQPPNPYAIDRLDAPLHALIWVGGLGLFVLSLAAVAALIQRYRRAGTEERQQVRWLATVGVAAGVALIFVLLTSIGMAPAETRPINDLAFILFAICIGFGIPWAVAVALLCYHLYELDLVLKKTLVFVSLVVVLMGVSFAVGLALANAAAPALRSDRLLIAVGLCAGILVIPLFRVVTRFADRVVYGGRATPYEVLTSFGERMSDTYSTDDVLPRTAQLLASATGATSAAVWLLVGRELRRAAVWPHDDAEPADVPVSGDALPMLPADWAEEVRDRGELVGALAVDMPANDPIGPGRQRLIRDLAAQAGLAIRNVRLVEDLRASRRRIVAAQDDRAKTLERNIHDGAQQQLVALAVKQRLLGEMIGRDDERARSLAAELATDANEALENLRDLARGIYPPLLADQGLGAALQAQARKAAVPTEVTGEIGRFAQDVESAIYFSCLEALQNVAKYARATHATITLTNGEGALRFAVRDDGVGFDPATTAYGSGLQGITDRLAAIGGALVVESEPGGGTAVVGTVPV